MIWSYKLLLILCCLIISLNLFSTSDIGFYFMGGGSGGGALQNSKDIEKVLNNYYKINMLQFDMSARAIVGYQNVFQCEYRHSWRGLDINSHFGNGYEENTLHMNLQSDQCIIKIAPFRFDGAYDDRNLSCVFLMYGFGKSKSLKDKTGDGFFDGNLQTFGIEYPNFYLFNERNNIEIGSVGISLEYETIEYSSFNVIGIGVAPYRARLGCVKLNLVFTGGFNIKQ